MREPILIFKCGKCGKPQPVDKKESNKNWKCYDNEKPCKCGALDWKIKLKFK